MHVQYAPHFVNFVKDPVHNHDETSNRRQMSLWEIGIQTQTSRMAEHDTCTLDAASQTSLYLRYIDDEAKGRVEVIHAVACPSGTRRCIVFTVLDADGGLSTAGSPQDVRSSDGHPSTKIRGDNREDRS